MARRGLEGGRKVQIPTLLDLPIPFKKPNLYFARLQNVEITLREADGDFPNLQQVAYGKRRGTQLWGQEFETASRVHGIFPYTVGDENFLLSGISYKDNVIDEGTATGGTKLILIDTAQAWTVDEYANKYLTYIHSSKTYKVLIKSNTANTLTFVKEMEEAPVATDTYEIQTPDEMFKSTSSANVSVQNYLAPGSHIGGGVFSSYSGTPVKTGGNTSVKTGTATGGSATTLVTTGLSSGAYNGKVIKWTNASNEDFFIEILSNTTTTFTFVGEVSAEIIPTSGDAYTVYTPAVPYETGTWTANASFNEQSGNSVLTDTSANWKENELIGMEVYANITDDNYKADKYTVISNTTTKLWLSGNVAYYIDTAGTKTDTNISGKKYKVQSALTALTYMDNSLDMEDNKYSGKILRISDGNGKGQVRDILGNTSSTFTITTPWFTNPDITSQYEIYDQIKRTPVFYFSDGYKPLSRYDGDSSVELKQRPAGQQIIGFAGRTFITLDPNNPYSIYYSEVNDPEFFPPQNIITPEGDDKITGIIEWNKRLIIFKERSIWEFQFTFDTATQIMSYSLDQVPSSEGCIAPRSIVKTKEYIWYLASNYTVQRLGAHEVQLGIISTKSESFFVDTLLSQIDKNNLDDVVGVYDGRFYFLSVHMNSNYNNFIFVHDSKYENAWLTRTGNDFGSFAQYGSTIYAGGSNDGKIRTLHSDIRCDDYDTDDETSGRAIEQVIMEKLLNMGNSFYHKLFVHQDIAFENTGAEIDYQAEVFRTNGKYTVTGSNVVGGGNGGPGSLGDVLLGDTILGGVRTTRKLIAWRKTISKRGYHIQTKLINNKRKENMVLVGSTHWYTTSSLKDVPIAIVS